MTGKGNDAEIQIGLIAAFIFHPEIRILGAAG